MLSALLLLSCSAALGSFSFIFFCPFLAVFQYLFLIYFIIFLFIYFAELFSINFQNYV